MPELATIQRVVQIDDVTYRQTINRESTQVRRASPSIPAAKPGDLTTRTNDTTGTLTMDVGHGIATADVIDLYWNGGSRRGVVVGTVATNSVPISGGAGDNLPVALTPITAMENVAEEYELTGDDATVIVLSSPVPATVHFASSGGTVIDATIPLEADDNSSPKYVYVWDDSSGADNPLAGLSIDTLLITHGSESEQDITVCIHIDP